MAHGKARASVVVSRLGNAPVRLMPWSRWPMKTNSNRVSKSPANKGREIERVVLFIRF